MSELDLEISCRSVQALLQSADRVLLVDCREPAEHALVTLDNAVLMPMSQLTEQLPLSKLVDASADRVIVYCHHGLRSAQVAAWLRQQGYPHAQSMAGGIDRWAVEIAPNMPRY